MALLSCPFCREMFVEGETERCPECGLVLRDAAALPPSPEALALLYEEAKLTPAEVIEDEPLPWTHVGAGRGPLMACAIAGMVAFFLPWAIQTVPQTESWTGAEMARATPFFWTVFTAWLVLVPAAMSRRTRSKMLGARVALMALALVPAVVCGFLANRPARVVSAHHVTFVYHWAYAFHATWVLSIVAVFIAFGFGRGAQPDVLGKDGR